MLLFKRYQYDPRIDLIGKGGFSRVYKAWDKKLNRQVALKVYRTNEVSEKYSPIDEIRRVVGLDHPNISRYFDIDEIINEDSFGQEEKIQVCVMELLDGGNLGAYYNQNRDLNVLKKLLIDVLQGLSFLHRSDIIHRDVKPANILVKKTPNGPLAKITDFGISKKTDTPATSSSSSSSLIVSIPYMAPEQLNAQKYGIGEKIHYNIDLWSLGVTIYEIITDDVLFKNNIQDSSEQVMMNIIREDIPEKIKSLPEPFKEFVSKCVIRDAKERVKTADELIPLLRNFSEKLTKDSTGTGDLGSVLSDHSVLPALPQTTAIKRKSEIKANQIPLEIDETKEVPASLLESAEKQNDQQYPSEEEISETKEVSGIVLESIEKQEEDRKLIAAGADKIPVVKPGLKESLELAKAPIEAIFDVTKETAVANEKLLENDTKQEEQDSINSQTESIDHKEINISIESVEQEKKEQSKNFEITHDTKLVPAVLLESLVNQQGIMPLIAGDISESKDEYAKEEPIIKNGGDTSIHSGLTDATILIEKSTIITEKLETNISKENDIESIPEPIASQVDVLEPEIKNEGKEIIPFDSPDETILIEKSTLIAEKLETNSSKKNDIESIPEIIAPQVDVMEPEIKNEGNEFIPSDPPDEAILIEKSIPIAEKLDTNSSKENDSKGTTEPIAPQADLLEPEIINEKNEFIPSDPSDETIIINKSIFENGKVEQEYRKMEDIEHIPDPVAPPTVHDSAPPVKQKRNKDSTMTLFKRYVYNPNKDLIGRGGFSRVYRAMDQKLGRWVALKIYKTSEFSDRYSPIAEIKRVVNLDHPNICRYLDIEEIEKINPFGETEKIQVCVMELLDSGNFLEYFNQHGKDLDVLKKLLQDVLNGISYLHKNGIIHRDIKPANILIKKNTEGPVAKITDFGISKASDSVNNNSSSALIVSIPYMTPEQLNIKKYGINGKISYNLDLWSLGVTVYEIITGNVMFKNSEQDSSEQIMANIMSPELPEKIKELPQPFRNIVSHCIVKNANERAQKAEELMVLLNSAIAQPPEIIQDITAKVIVNPELEREVLKADKLKAGPEKPEPTVMQKKFSIAQPAPEIEKRAKKRINSLRIAIFVAGVLLVIASVFYVFNSKIDSTIKQDVVEKPADKKDRDTIENKEKKDSVSVVNQEDSFRHASVKIPPPKKEPTIKEKINQATPEKEKTRTHENIDVAGKNVTKVSVSKEKYVLTINANQPCTITKNGSNVGSVNGKSLQVFLVPGEYNFTGTTEDGRVSSKKITVTDMQAGKSGNLSIDF